MTQVIKVVYARLGGELTKRKLGQAVPVAGILIGAALNAKLLAAVTDDAEQLYRERFLREKYGLPVPSAPLSRAADPDDLEDVIDIAEVVEHELDRAAAAPEPSEDLRCRTV